VINNDIDKDLSAVEDEKQNMNADVKYCNQDLSYKFVTPNAGRLLNFNNQNV